MSQKVDPPTRDDHLFADMFGRKDYKAAKFVLELSLSCDDGASSDLEETKLYCEGGLSKHSKVVLLKAFMLHKQMSWLRKLMRDTFEEGIHNWRLPLNHCIPVNSAGMSAWGEPSLEFVNVQKGCRRLGGPFDASALYSAIGGNIRLYKAQEKLYEFTRRLQEAQRFKREAILPTEGGGYKLQLAINEVLQLPTIYTDDLLVNSERDSTVKR